jgi:probable HAF family extracellular repeat protein
MKRFRKSHIFALSYALAAIPAAWAQTQNFTTLDYPGAASTQAWGINPSGDVVGYYVNPDKSSHGFLLSAGEYKAINYPGAALTLVNGINAAGELIGEFAANATDPHRGFVMGTDGVFTTIDYPGAASTSGIGINANGEITGLYSFADNVNHGFLLSSGRFSSFDFPGSTRTGPNGIGPRGEIIGAYSAGGVTHGFVLRNGDFTSINVPGAATTIALGINRSGAICGRYIDTGGVSHGFLLSADQFTTIDVPGATFTGANSIGPGGDIAGRYTAGGVTHGFLLSAAATHQGNYSVTDLGTVGQVLGQPFYLTNNGLVSGTIAEPNGTMDAVVWFQNQRLGLGPKVGGLNAVAFGVNSGGYAAGMSETTAPDPNSEDFCGFKSLGLPSKGNLECAPFVWQNGKGTALPTLGGLSGVVNQINDAGEAVGLAENTIKDTSCPLPQLFQFKPVVWSNGKAHQLPTVGGDLEGSGFAINQSGQIVGASGRCSTFNPNLLTPLQPLHALLWEEGTVTDLGNLGGQGTFNGHIAINLNNRGQVVGGSDLPGDAAFHAFLWSQKTGMKDLGTLEGDAFSGGSAINDHGVVTGISLDADFSPRAFIWRDGVMADLNSLIPATSPLYLLLACSINASGEIIGLAADQTGDLHGYLLTPSTGGGSGADVALGARRPMLSDAAAKQLQKRLGSLGIRFAGRR